MINNGRSFMKYVFMPLNAYRQDQKFMKTIAKAAKSKTLQELADKAYAMADGKKNDVR